MSFPRHECPGCHAVLHGASPVGGGPGVVPTEGDISICVGCGHPMMLERGEMRSLREADYFAITPAMRGEIARAVAFVRAQARGPLC